MKAIPMVKLSCPSLVRVGLAPTDQQMFFKKHLLPVIPVLVLNSVLSKKIACILLFDIPDSEHGKRMQKKTNVVMIAVAVH